MTTPEQQEAYAISSLVDALHKAKILNYDEKQLNNLEYRASMWKLLEPTPQETKLPDLVNHPPHYKSEAGIEVIHVLEAFNLNFRLANCVKYILRHASKGNPLQDLKKAQWYLNREIAKMESVEGEAKAMRHAILTTKSK